MYSIIAIKLSILLVKVIYFIVVNIVKKMTLHTTTLDNGKEFTQHERVGKTLKVSVYFVILTPLVSEE